MRLSWKKVVAFVCVAAVAFGMSLPTSQAASAARGKFKLPFDANLNKVALPSGEYTFSVDHLDMDAIVTIYQGTNGIAILHPQSFSSYDKQGVKPVLVFVRHDGNTTLRALRFPGSGTFYFPLPKGLKVLSAKQPQLLETISVEVSGD
jgi:hypothetical protein